MKANNTQRRGKERAAKTGKSQRRSKGGGRRRGKRIRAEQGHIVKKYRRRKKICRARAVSSRDITRNELRQRKPERRYS